MSEIAKQQLDAIHSMLNAGHRNLRVERPSLLLWGATFGGLILASNHILTANQIPDIAHRAVAWLLLLTFAVGGISAIDWHWTRRAKQDRDEAWSFIHRQVLKVWWLLLATGVLLTFATFFYGGGYLVLAAWLILVGLGLYVHGLFSEESLEWTGAMIIAIGISAAAFRLNFHAMQLVAASTLGLGLPALAILLDGGRRRGALVRLGQSLLWLAIVLAPPLLAQRAGRLAQPAPARSVTLAQYRAAPAGRLALTLPAGSVVPVHVRVEGDTFRPSRNSVLPLVLDHPVQVIVDHGRLTGAWRESDGGWRTADSDYWIAIPRLAVVLDPVAGPEVQADLLVDTRRGHAAAAP